MTLVAPVLAVAPVVASAASLSLAPGSLAVHTAGASVPASTCVAPATADVYADESSPLSNFGTATTLHVRSGTTLLLVPANERTFARFDLGTCAVPAGARIVSATMKLFLSTAPSVSRTYRAHRISSTWDENALTWNSQPEIAASPTAEIASGTAASVFLEWDVRSDVEAFLAGTTPNHGWRVSDSVESATGEARFDAREHPTLSGRPSLTITYYP